MKKLMILLTYLGLCSAHAITTTYTFDGKIIGSQNNLTSQTLADYGVGDGTPFHGTFSYDIDTLISPQYGMPPEVWVESFLETGGYKLDLSMLYYLTGSNSFLAVDNLKDTSKDLTFYIYDVLFDFRLDEKFNLYLYGNIVNAEGHDGRVFSLSGDMNKIKVPENNNTFVLLSLSLLGLIAGSHAPRHFLRKLR